MYCLFNRLGGDERMFGSCIEATGILCYKAYGSVLTYMGGGDTE